MSSTRLPRSAEALICRSHAIFLLVSHQQEETSFLKKPSIGWTWLMLIKYIFSSKLSHSRNQALTFFQRQTQTYRLWKGELTPIRASLLYDPKLKKRLPIPEQADLPSDEQRQRSHHSNGWNLHRERIVSVIAWTVGCTARISESFRPLSLDQLQKIQPYILHRQTPVRANNRSYPDHLEYRRDTHDTIGQLCL